MVDNEKMAKQLLGNKLVFANLKSDLMKKNKKTKEDFLQKKCLFMYLGTRKNCYGIIGISVFVIHRVIY